MESVSSGTDKKDKNCQRDFTSAASGLQQWFWQKMPARVSTDSDTGIGEKNENSFARKHRGDGMEPLIEVINKLQDVFNAVGSEGIQLPQIVVMGTQSAGKSSVIEALVRGSFLPRGTGIVTRRPLVLQLINCPLDDTKYRSTEKGTKDLEKWGEFVHKPDQIYSDFNKIREEIDEETDRVAGTNKGIISQPINLRIYSADVVNLTLVDLPGITKVPVGDQPEDIEDQIKNLVLEYINNPNSIILAVTAANTDLATSEALKMAKDADPEGARTLAVLTKLDLMDDGTDAHEVLTGTVIPVKLGIIGVINRSQMDITKNKKLEFQLDKEAKFLTVKYPTLAARNGTPYLAKTLSRLLMNHIHKCLPDVRQRIHAKMAEIQSVVKTCGKEIVDKDQTLMHIITQFSQAYQRTIEGIKPNIDSDEAFGITKLYKILHEDFEISLQAIQPRMDPTGDDILSALSNASGPRPTLFDNPSFDSPFEIILKNQLEQLYIPALNCLDLVHKEMVRNIRNCGTAVQLEMQRFPKLYAKIVEVVTAMLRTQLEVAKSRVTDVIDKEIAYINKKHPYFKQEAALEDSDEEVQEYKRYILKSKFHFKFGVSDEQIKNCAILDKLTTDYFNVIRKSLQDSVPKTIVHFLVNAIIRQLGPELFKRVFKLGAENMMRESEIIMIQRKHAKELLDALLRANQIIDEVSDGTEAFDEEECESNFSESSG